MELDNIEQKNFESRLKFIRSVFENKYSKDDILKSSVQFKLGKSYENYLDEINSSLSTIINTSIPKNPMTVLKKVDKGEE